MYCNHCGTAHPVGALTCAQCHRALASAHQKIPNYLSTAILVTVCCCVPFGIPGIVYAAQVNAKIAGGDIEGALDSSKKAKLWSWVGFLCGGVGFLLYFIATFAGVAAQ